MKRFMESAWKRGTARPEKAGEEATETAARQETAAGPEKSAKAEEDVLPPKNEEPAPPGKQSSLSALIYALLPLTVLLLFARLLTVPYLVLPPGGGEQADGGYVLYFPEQSFAPGTGVLRAVPSSLRPEPGADTRTVAVKLAMELLNGPQEEGLRSAFPAGTTLRSLDIQGSRAVADFSASYGTLSGVALTLADYSVALTLTQLPEISLVRITVRGQELAYRDRQSFMARDVQLEPETDVVGTIHALLYFPDEAGSLIPEERVLSLYEGDTQVEAVTEAVEGGPEDRNLFAAFPGTFRVRSVWQEGDLCFVNLSSALLDALPEDTDLSVCLRALDLSLSSLENVGEVRYLVDGVFLRQYGGFLLAEPYGQAEKAESPPDTGTG